MASTPIRLATLYTRLIFKDKHAFKTILSISAAFSKIRMFYENAQEETENFQDIVYTMLQACVIATIMCCKHVLSTIMIIINILANFI